jgi:hypothetical protein
MNVSEDGKSAALAVTDHCCAWVRASATIADGTIHAAATDASGKPVHNTPLNRSLYCVLPATHLDSSHPIKRLRRLSITRDSIGLSRW